MMPFSKSRLRQEPSFSGVFFFAIQMIFYRRLAKDSWIKCDWKKALKGKQNKHHDNDQFKLGRRWCSKTINEILLFNFS